MVESLKKYINVKTVTRDRSSSYKEAIDEAIPNAIHIVDRFHLTKELAEHCEVEIKSIIKNNILQFNEKTFKPIKGKNIRKNKSMLAKHRQIMIDFIKNGLGPNKIFKELKKNYGFEQSIDGVIEYYKYLKKNIIKENVITINRTAIMKLLYSESKIINKKRVTRARKIEDLNITELEKKCLKKYIEENDSISNLIKMSEEFNNIIYNRDSGNLLEWLEKYENNNYKEDLSRFIKGIKRDLEYVQNSININFNNGIAEGSVNLIKMIKRTMFGRCGFNLLTQKIFLFQLIPN